MSTWPCKSARRFANLQTALHINKGLLHICRGLCTQYSGPMHMCKAACRFAKPFAAMQRRAFMCSSACLCARPSVYLQAAMHVCTTPCLFAARPACMHGAVFIRKRPCICAERHACLSDVCACVQSRVLICTSTCTRARFTRSLQRKLNLRHDLWVEVTSQHGLLPESHPGVFETSKCQNVNPSAFSANNRRGYRSLAGISPEEHPGSTIPLTSLIQADFGYGAGMDVEFECQDCGIFRSGRAA